LGADDSWVQIGKINGVPYVVLNMDRETFIQNDRGGSVYEIDNKNFECHLDKGMGKDEWVCSDEVTIKNAEEHDSVLRAMIDEGVQVYFVDESTFEQICQSEYGGVDVLNGLVSENQSRQVNVHRFEND
jgi:translation elongation factor P/translation initiation factor 5A